MARFDGVDRYRHFYLSLTLPLQLIRLYYRFAKSLSRLLWIIDLETSQCRRSLDIVEIVPWTSTKNMNSTKFTCIFVWICGFYVILLASKVNAETIKRFPYPPKPPKKNVTNTDNKTPKAVNGTNDKSTDAKKAAHVLQESNDLESIFKRHYTLVKKCFDSKKVIRSEKQARDLKTILSYNSTYDPVIEVSVVLPLSRECL